MESCIPFLKWAGGKRWLVANYSEFLPSEFNRYIEPFLGSGAVFFHMKPKHGILSDANEELVETYNAIKEDWERVLYHLRRHDQHHSYDYYYQMRDFTPKSKYTRAARFIYLNRTCFNGLYRVNLEGKFNVPIGSKQNVLLNTDDFESISASLKNFEVLHSDFEQIIDKARNGDLLFVDPPYTVKHNENGFIKYNEKLFSWEDQLRLKDALLRASNRGAHIVLTNAKHDSIKKLYQREFKLLSLNRNNLIAAKAENRGVYGEYLIMRH